MIKLGEGRFMKQVGELRYKQVFRQNGYLYMRVDSKQIRKDLSLRGAAFDWTRPSLNTEEEVVVIRLSTGKLTYFQRHCMVTPVTLHCDIRETNDDEC